MDKLTPPLHSATVFVNMFALVMPWQGFNGLDVLQFTVVHVLRKHGALSCALPAQLLNGFSNYAYLQEFF